MSFWQAVQSVFANYAGFSGRAARSEFWYWILFATIAGIAAAMADLAVDPDSDLISGLWGLATFVPGLAVAARRLHDADWSGWWLLLFLLPFFGTLFLIVLFCFRGSHGYNRFGADPLPPEVSLHAAGRSLRRGQTNTANDEAPRPDR